MALKVGIIGLPNVGKSTLFNALTKKSVDAANYPFCTIDPSVGIVPVPDNRLEALGALSQSEKTIPAVVEFVDIAGLVAGAAEGEGLGNKFLSNIREVDALLHVVRVFEDNNIAHVHGGVDPVHDMTVIHLELILADLETVKKRQEKMEKDLKANKKDAHEEMYLLERIREALENEQPASSVTLTAKEEDVYASLHLLTAKPVLYVLNAKSEDPNSDVVPEELRDFFEKTNASYIVVDAESESDMRDLSEEEKSLFQKKEDSVGGGLGKLIAKAYQLLNLITFFTTGPKESRAWTIEKGVTAPEAGAVIHTDFQEKFIKADVIFWKDLVEAGGYAPARARGLVRTEGKAYVVKDGDVILFKI